MKFHGVEMIGPFWAQAVPTLPTWSASDEKRFIYNQFDKKFYYANNTGWVEVSQSTHTHAGVYLPVGGKAADSDLLDGLDSTAYAKITGGNTFTGTQNLSDGILQRPELKDYAETLVAAGSGQDYTFNLENGNTFVRTVTGSSIFTFSNPPVTGRVGSFTIILVNGASFPITWPNSVVWPNNISPTLQANTTSLADVITFFTLNGGTRWYGNLAIKKLAYAA